MLLSCIFLAGCATVYYPQPTVGRVEQGRGIYHVVRSGETLWSISQAYGVDVDELARRNHIRNFAAIQKGQRLFIPGASKELDVGAVKPDLNAKEFEWPLRGKILSYFHGRGAGFWKQGIRIQSDSRQTVSAARAGKVVFSDNLMGYGPTVIVDHQDGFLSVYANNGQCLVNVGDRVNKGDTVAQMPGGDRFLYFEIRRHGQAENPLFYLPKN